MAYNLKYINVHDQVVETTWNVSTKKPDIKGKVTVLFVSGEELDEIRKCFKNLPITNGYLCMWRGEMAQFIYDNL